MVKIQVEAAILAIGFIAVASANSVASNEDCPSICPLHYAPVCAFNGKIYKEFANSCTMKDSNCRLEKSRSPQFVKVFDEWCSSELVENIYEALGNPDLTTPECYHPCPMIYDPVCISNGKIRGLAANECEMESFNKCMGEKMNLFKVLQQKTC